MAKVKKEKKIKEPKEKSASLFDYIKWLTSEKKDWNELTSQEQKGFNVYIVNRVLSMELSFCEAINEMQEYTLSMDKELVWRIYKTILPPNNYYNTYIKPSPIKDINEKEICIFVKYFNCSEKQAVEYLTLLNKKGLNEEIEKIKSNFSYE